MYDESTPTLKELAAAVHRILGREIMRLDSLGPDTALDPKETSQLKIYAEMVDAARLREINFGSADTMGALPTEALKSRFADDDDL